MFADRLTYNLVILFTNNLFSFFPGKPVRISILEKVGGRVALRARWEGEGIG
jgi:hypothetical protein